MHLVDRRRAVVSKRFIGLTVALAITTTASAAAAQGSPWGVGRIVRGSSSPVDLPMNGVPGGLSAVAIGGEFALGLTSSGNVISWRIPAGAQQSVDAPRTIAMGAGMTAIAAGARHALALRTDGSVWTWGVTCVSTPDADADHASPVEGLPPARAIAAGDGFSLVLARDGSVWGWGSNDHSQLARDPSECVAAPVRIESLASVNAIAVGSDHALALSSDGSVYAWGANDRGQLGRERATVLRIPTRVDGVANATAIAAGAEHSLAVMGDERRVVAWGANDAGQLGIGTMRDTFSPTRVGDVRDVEYVVASAHHSAVLTRGGEMWSWGANDSHQLGTDGVDVHATLPVRVNIPRDTHALAAGPFETIAIEGSAMALADLAIAASVAVRRVNHARRYVVHLEVTNLGPDAAVAPVIETELPEGVSLASVTIGRGTCSSHANAIRCTVDRMGDGERLQIEAVASPPGPHRAWSQHAHVIARTGDPDPMNDDADVTSEHPSTTTVTAARSSLENDL